ncbi:MAG: hypothetical protein WCD69_24725 [Xanthobacteraceae bacterium]
MATKIITAIGPVKMMDTPPSASSSIPPTGPFLLPPLLAMAPGGSTDISSMVWEILARPSQLPLLLRLAADAYAARTALVRLRRALGPAFSNE